MRHILSTPVDLLFITISSRKNGGLPTRIICLFIKKIIDLDQFGFWILAK